MYGSEKVKKKLRRSGMHNSVSTPCRLHGNGNVPDNGEIYHLWLLSYL